MSKNIQNPNKPPLHPSTLAQIEQITIGPIPPALELDKYKQINPSFPERIMKMAENHNHANTIERTKLLHKGMNMSFVLLFIITIAGIYFGIIGNIALATLLLSPIIITTLSDTIKKSLQK